MNNKRFDRIRKTGSLAKDDFQPFADYVVADEVGETPDENRKVIAMFTAIDMASGAEMKKSEYLLTGGLIGSAIMLVTGLIILHFKKKKDKG
jgi:hypothetical protein